MEDFFPKSTTTNKRTFFKYPTEILVWYGGNVFWISSTLLIQCVCFLLLKNLNFVDPCRKNWVKILAISLRHAKLKREKKEDTIFWVIGIFAIRKTVSLTLQQSNWSVEKIIVTKKNFFRCKVKPKEVIRLFNRNQKAGLNFWLKIILWCVITSNECWIMETEKPSKRNLNREKIPVFFFAMIKFQYRLVPSSIQ